MAKENPSIRVMAVPEKNSSTGTFYWRPIAMEVGGRVFSTNDQPDVPMIRAEEPFKLFFQPRVMDIDPEREEILRFVQQEVYEVYDQSDEFSKIMYDDADGIRNLLGKGFELFQVQAKCMERSADQGYNLIIALRSPVGKRYGLLIRSDMKVEQEPIRKHFYRMTVKTDTADPQKGVTSISVVDYTKCFMAEQRYESASGEPRQRWFLGSKSKPETVTILPPNFGREYVPIFAKRLLNQSKQQFELEEGRQLTKKDIEAVLSFLTVATEDDALMGDLLRIADVPEVVERLSGEIRDYVQSELAPRIEEDKDLYAAIRAALFVDPQIKEAMIDEAATLWFARESEERDALLAEIQTHEEELERRKSLEAECAELERKCAALKQKAAESGAELDANKAALREALDEYRADRVKLLVESIGGPCSGSAPLVIASCPAKYVSVYEDNLGSDDALRFCAEENLRVHENDKQRLGNVPETIWKMFSERQFFAAHALVAQEIADCLSVAKTGMTVARVFRADENCTTEDLYRAIANASGEFVVVYGMYCQAADMSCIALGEKVKSDTDKYLIFAEDNTTDDVPCETLQRLIPLLVSTPFDMAKRSPEEPYLTVTLG